MVAIKNSERLELLANLLRNCKVQLMENVMTRDFNRKLLEENPKFQDKIMPLIITIESDIKQTVAYTEFIEKVIEELKDKPADEIYIIFEDKNKGQESAPATK